MRSPYHINGKNLVMVPRLARVKVMQLAHNSMIAGHFGRERTLEAIRRRMDWPGIATDIKNLCQSCPICQKASPAVVAKAPLQYFENTISENSDGHFWPFEEDSSIYW